MRNHILQLIKSSHGLLVLGMGLTLIVVDYCMLIKSDYSDYLAYETKINVPTNTLVEVPENRLFFTNSTYSRSSGVAHVAKNHKESGREYAIDILSIGSIKNIRQAQVQAKTWGSHISRRIFWLATEYDDPDPECHYKMSFSDVETISNKCGSKAADNWFSKHIKQRSMKWNWLKKKKNPAGWVCAQKRFPYAFSSVLKKYQEARDNDLMDLPDYLILGDDE